MIDNIQSIMKKHLTQKEKIILSVTIAIWGVILIGSGLVLNAQDRTITKTVYSLNVSKKRVAQQRTNEIKLKKIEIEINTPLSVDVKDYLEDLDNLEENIFDYLKLDISTVKNTEVGEYTYTITYKKKKYNGTVKIKEKELPNVVLQLKSIKLENGKPIPSDIESYVSTPLTDEMKNNITLDISKINNSAVGTYQYTIIYNKATYIGTVEVYNPQPQIKTPGSEQVDENKEKEKEKETNPQQ